VQPQERPADAPSAPCPLSGRPSASPGASCCAWHGVWSPVAGTRKAADATARYLRQGRPKLLGEKRTTRLFLGKLGGPMDRGLLSIMVRERTKPRKPDSRSRSRAIPSATPWRHISSAHAPTSAISSNASGTRRSPPPSATHTSRSKIFSE
jgi:hypothetical protein